MKKILIGVLAGSMLFIGCSSKNNEITKPKTCQIEGQDAPVWICAPSDINGYITSVGSAQKTPLGFSFQRTEAISAARDALARRISVKVKNIFKRFERNTGVKPQSEKVVENVSKQLSDVTLRNSKLITSWQSKKGTLFVLVGVPKNNLEDALISSPAMQYYQKKVANKEWKNLDKEIKAEFGE